MYIVARRKHFSHSFFFYNRDFFPHLYAQSIFFHRYTTTRILESEMLSLKCLGTFTGRKDHQRRIQTGGAAVLRRQKVRGFPPGYENVYRFEFQDGRPE